MSRKVLKLDKIPDTISSAKFLDDDRVSVQTTDTFISPGAGSVGDLNVHCCGFYQHEEYHVQKAKFSSTELNEKIHKLHKHCLVHLHDSYMVHINRTKGVKLLNEIIERCEFEDIKPVQVMSLVWCSLSCIHHFHIRLCAVKQRGIFYWNRRKQARKAMRCYESLLKATYSDMYGCIIHAIVTFLTESKMWEVDYLCIKLMKALFEITGESEGAVHAILDAAEKSSLTDVRLSRQIINVLFYVLDDYQWNDLEYSLMKRFIMMYYKAMSPSPDDPADFAVIKRGLEGCIRNIFKNIPHANLLRTVIVMVKWLSEEDFSDESLLDFGILLEYAASIYTPQLYSDTLRFDVFPALLEFVASEDRLRSLLGTRILNCMLDRHKNAAHFNTPIIFLNDAHYNITLGKYNTEDKTFLKTYREEIHSTFLRSIEMHSQFRMNLENIYTTIALITMEIPCGFSAAAIVCLMMAVQEYTLSADNLELTSRNNLHAMVVSIMSLVCWVHKAQVFYDYVRAIIKRRAQFAPHLNPPLLPTYEYAQHHVLWNKPELFFEDWEVRYGLWKCFRTKRARLQTLAIKAVGNMHELM